MVRKRRPARSEATFAAIDVGTNAVRLKLARPRASGALEVLHEERDPIRPGEGVFKTGSVPPEVAARLLATMRRYAAIARRHHAVVRGVATSALREARNGPQILRRIKNETGLELELISGREEARLVCLGVLEGTAPSTRSLVIDIGGGSTEVAVAAGENPTSLYSLALGAVRLTEIFDAAAEIPPRRLKLMREYAKEITERGLPARIRGAPRRAIGSSGTIRAVVGFAATPATGHATLEQISQAVDQLVEMGLAGRRLRFDPRRAEIIVAGAVVLEAAVRRLGLSSIAATDRSLRDGVLIDLARRHEPTERDRRLVEAAISLGGVFSFNEAHARQVAHAATILFDTLARRHLLPPAWRRYLEVAALLHDVGHAVGYQRHHKHAAYIIQNADIPGLTDHECDLVARIARYHRRSLPELHHSGMEGLRPGEAALVRRCATILRLADAFDRSHHQPVKKLTASLAAGRLKATIVPSGPIDLELWDLEHEAALFTRVFRRKLAIDVKRR